MKKSIKNLVDRNEIIIRWADEMIFNSNHLGVINKNSLMPGTFQTSAEINVWRNNEEGKIRNHVILLLGDTKGNLDIETNQMVSYLEGIKNHLLSHRYIEDPRPAEYLWVLTKRGDLVKELGGHFKYQTYRKRKLNVLKNQNLINWCLILATALAAIMPFVAERINRPTSIQYLQPPALYPVVSVSIDTDFLKKLLLKGKDSIKSIHLPIKPK